MLRSTLFSIFLLINLFPLSTLAKESAEPILSPTIQKTITSFYSAYDKKRQCWVAKDKHDRSQHYCLKLINFKQIQTDEGKRYYILLSGEVLNEKGEPFGAHVSSGLVGAFVFHNSRLVAHDAYYPIGAFGKPPEDWSIIKLSDDDYWAWLSEWGDCHFGYCGGRYVLLAPYGKNMKNLAAFTSSYSDEGTGKFENGGATNLESSLIVDTTQKAEQKTGIYPLKITIKGENAGKALKQSEWILPFNRKKWAYIEPKGWALADREF